MKKNTNYINVQNNTMSFKELSYIWLDSKKNTVKYSTIAKYSNILNKHLIPRIGEFQLNDVDNRLIENVCMEWLTLNNENTLSTKTINDIICVIKGIYKFGYKINVINNIKINIDLLPVKRKKIRTLSLEEEQKLISYLKNNMTRYNLGIFICLFTGIRVGELCALKWKDYSTLSHTLTINHTIQRLPSVEKNEKRTQLFYLPPKSDYSIRTIPIPNILYNEMERYIGKDEEFILSGNAHKYIEPRLLQYHLQKILNIIGINNVSFHTLRHTFATTCIEVGFDIKSLSEILGHSNVNITLNRYVHPSMNIKKAHMEKLSSLFPNE